MKDGGIDGEAAEGVDEVNSSSSISNTNNDTPVIKWRFKKTGGWEGIVFRWIEWGCMNTVRGFGAGAGSSDRDDGALVGNRSLGGVWSEYGATMYTVFWRNCSFVQFIHDMCNESTPDTRPTYN